MTMKWFLVTIEYPRDGGGRRLRAQFEIKSSTKNAAVQQALRKLRLPKLYFDADEVGVFVEET